MKKKQPPAVGSLLMVAIIILLSSLGLLFVFEASVAEAFNTFGDQYYFLKLHALGLLIGVFAFIAGLLMPLKQWLKVAPTLLLVGIALMIAVFIPGIGLELNGAHRWISLGPISFQPVEIFKFSLIAYLALWLTKDKTKEPPLAPFLIFLGIASIFLLLQPDLGSLLVVIAISFGMFFVAGGNLKHVAMIAAIGIPAILLVILMSPYRRDRLTTFLNPEHDLSGKGYHVRQITLALGRGGLFGQGIGNSNQKFAYIPEASTDSIFAIIAEELGFLGSLVIIIVFATFVILAYKHINVIEDPGVRLLGMGLLIWISSQIILNLAAVAALVPLTGIPLPFFSYGRSAQVMILFASGVMVRMGKTQ
jgi:cell division protein FtsW